MFLRVRQRGRQVMQHAAAGRHAARGDDDRGLPRRGTSSFDCCGDATTVMRVGAERADVCSAAGRMSAVELVDALRVELQRAGGHRAVDVDRQHRNPLLLLEPLAASRAPPRRGRSRTTGMISLPPRRAGLVDDRRQPRRRRRRPRAGGRRRSIRRSRTSAPATGVGSGSTGRP